MGKLNSKLITSLSEPLSFTKDTLQWENWQLILFRFLFLFFLFFIIPIDPSYFKLLFESNWLENPFYGLLILAKYQPEFIPLIDAEGVPAIGLASFANWIIVFIISAIGTFIWTAKNKAVKEYNVLVHWLRVLVRYRLAIVLFAYGIYKLFLLQIPSPSLSNLFTNYGDAYAWKVYYQTTSLSSFYVAFLGTVEIIAALLLVFRKTVTWAAGLVLGYVGNIAVANSFYDLGDLSLSTFIVVGAFFLFVPQVSRLIDLLIKEIQVKPNKLLVDYTKLSWKKWRIGLKSIIAILFLLFVLTGFSESQKGFGSFKYPQTEGLKDAYGIYDVKEFLLDKDTISYSNTDSVRWQNVIFEKWSTISVKSLKPLKIDRSSGEVFHTNDIDRNYELAGFSGRHYYHYSIDTNLKQLHFSNKNKHHKEEKFVLNYSCPNDTIIELSGKNEKGQDVKIVLAKVAKSYMLLEGRRKASRL